MIIETIGTCKKCHNQELLGNGLCQSCYDKNIDLGFKGEEIKDEINTCVILEELSEKEKEVLGLIGQGYNNNAIAIKLNMNPKSIETMLGYIYNKISVPECASKRAWLALHCNEIVRGYNGNR